MRVSVLLSGLLVGLMACTSGLENLPTKTSKSDLVFDSLAQTWDEGVPLGNATIGALVWKKGDALRLSLDRTDLWDLRPSDSLSRSKFRSACVKEHIRRKDYLPVQKKLDHPYDMEPAPAKIPGAALEFSLKELGNPSSVRLYLNDALCEVKWPEGTRLQTFVHASEPVGWFVFDQLDENLIPDIIAPTYADTLSGDSGGGPVEGLDLKRLGYSQGKVIRDGNKIVYHQKGFGDFYYEVAVSWMKSGKKLYGTWSVTTSLCPEKAEEEVEEAMKRGVANDYEDHTAYWDTFWKQSSVSLPDSLLQKQYDNEMYKLGSASRENSYPISLQAVWTADNGKLPPWKGDYHHDLNTQLSYWPVYTGNHLSEGLGYLNTLWNQRDVYKRYTRQYFETEGMNVPGVCTLTGEPMGGWIQYSMSQTIGAWLAQHFYLHWQYSADEDFLREKAYPFVRDVAVYLEQISFVDQAGVRRLEFSSSPEIYDNSLNAWFKDMTNYDLSLMRFLFRAASEMATSLKLGEEAAHWAQLESQLPAFDLDKEGALTFAKGHPYNESHRHFSHALAIHPLGLIDWSNGEKDQQIILATLKKMKDYGPDYWTGYTYAWYANMLARAFKGEEAAEALRVFASCFCLKNLFHANGDQSGTGKSLFTYRPFTLEGNFAFAAAVQEMLLQSHTGVVRVFPAIPEEWKDVAFTDLRARGGFLVSAERKGGKVVQVKIVSEKGGTLHFLSPDTGEVLEVNTKPGEVVSYKY